MRNTLSRIAITAVGIATMAGCGSSPAPSAAPAPAPVTAAAPTWLSCPDPTDGPSIVANAIDEAHRALTANAASPLPPPCVFSAFARIAPSVADSVNDNALALVAEARRRGPEPRELLAAEVGILARARRYAEVSRAYDRLVAIDSQPPTDVSRVAIAAAHQRGDTASLLRILSRTMARSDAGPAMRSEYNVIRQTSQLWAAINEGRGLLRQNPKYLVAYPSLVGNFGTLGLADSVVASTRRALAAGATRAAISPSLETLVSTMLRHAALYGSTYGWESVIAGASRVDSTLSTPSTKFLVAALTIHAAEPRIAELAALIGTPGIAPAADPAASQRRAAGCKRVPTVASTLDLAERRLREGGDRYPGGVGQFQAGLSSARDKLSSMQDICSRSGG